MDSKTDRLRDLMHELVVVEINRGGVVEAYAEITTFTTESGKTIGDNDRWIAATAKVTDATLLTTDHDFDILDQRFISRVWIDPKAKIE